MMAVFGQDYRSAVRAHAVAKAAADKLREGINAVCSRAKGSPLRIPRKDFEAIIALQDMTDSEFRAAEAKRLDWMRLAGLPVGAQLDLFEAPRDTVDEKVEAYAAGKRAGLRGDDQECPDTIAPILRADWEHGYADGQKELGERLFRGNALLAAHEKPIVELVEEDEDEGDDLDDENLDKAARDLKRSGWTQPTAEEAAFVGAEA
jgi:hypothetical protein